ncbi:MAG TPA: GNAT family N-acetyltransferase [Candidatus Bathyarchaeia archaeon]|nr:GNAT family N-acetyltransferase [Candidatus Bathyarchaeia archaeon]
MNRKLSPFGPFYCVFRWDLSKFDNQESNQPVGIRVRLASEGEIGAVAEVWYTGLREEEGSPWENYLKKWTPNSAARWFLDSTKRLGAKFLIVDREEKIVGINGIISEKNSGKGRFFTGVVVSPNHRRQGIGSLLLHQTLLVLKKEGLLYAEVETIQGIPAAKYLYTKYEGKSIQVPA